MTEWHPDRIKKLRGEVLRLLTVAHNQQRSRMEDTTLCHALHSLMVDCTIDDVITILQDMKDRNWVNFRQIKNVFPRRVQLLEITVLPEGRDIVEQTREHPAVIL